MTHATTLLARFPHHHKNHRNRPLVDIPSPHVLALGLPPLLIGGTHREPVTFFVAGALIDVAAGRHTHARRLADVMSSQRSEGAINDDNTICDRRQDG